uniref:Transmembrane ion channel n=1 Tax=Pristionchus pacificus TaxID=54126 RepID=A0A2A6C503_PRIPA|eukprot:PDM73255.1 transmembrane ion channel [Pristionchus pacificus]
MLLHTKTTPRAKEAKRGGGGEAGESWLRSGRHPTELLSPITVVAFLLFAMTAMTEAKAEGNNLRANMVAEHSRRTFRTHDPNMMNFANPIVDEIAASISSRLDVDEFVTSTRETLVEEEEEDYFREIWYDRNTTKASIHNICEEHRSGPARKNLTWSEPGDLLLKIVGNGIVKGGYNMFMAPGQAKGRETKIHVALYIESMSSFKAQTMARARIPGDEKRGRIRGEVVWQNILLTREDFEVDTYLAMGWFDRRLAHNCSYPILVTSKVISDRIWQPDLYFVNSKFAYLQEVTTPNMMVIVYPDGLVFKSMRL